MTLRTVVFVDGANFQSQLRSFVFHSGSLHPSGRGYRLEEHHFNWRSFFSAVIDKIVAHTRMEHRLVRVYWYYPSQISPWEKWWERRLAPGVLAKHPEVPDLQEAEVVEAARAWYDRESDYFAKVRNEVLERIQRVTDYLEFKYVGQYVVHPFTPYRISRNPDGSLFYLGTQVGEKGVDLGIAVDMMAKMPNYDAAILVSGDSDFLPVVANLKDNLRYVYQLSLAKGSPPSVSYLSPWLRGLVDCFLWVDERELLSEHLDRNSNIPPAVLESIDRRVSFLGGGQGSS